jgi:hypothetical protein
VTTYRPPRLGDLIHVRIGDGDEHGALIQTVGDDGKTITLTGPLPGRRDLVVVIRRVDRHLTKQET